MFCKAYEIYKSHVVLVIDNAPFYLFVNDDVLIKPEFYRHKILRLAPYLPMFNPIKHVWSVIKSYVKKHLAKS